MQGPSRKPLCIALLAALSAVVSSPALAANSPEASQATPCATPVNGQITCDASEAPLDGIDVQGVKDVEVVIKGDGVVIDGRNLPEGQTTATVYGDGDIKLTAGEGSVIIGHEGFGALDIGSTDGNVSVDVDTVIGDTFGIAAVAGGNIAIEANVVSGIFGVQGYSTGGDVDIHVKDTAYGYDLGAAVHGVTEKGDVSLAANRAFAEGFLATGFWGTSHDGSVFIDADTVRVLGDFSTGIIGESFATGDVNIGVNYAGVEGRGAVAIFALAVDGDVNIDAGNVSKSDEAEGGGGMQVFAINGGANIRAETVFSRGDFARALDVQTTGDANLELGYVSSMGVGAHAINVESAGEVNLKILSGIATFGADSYGVYAISNDDINLDIQNAITFGALSSVAWVEAGFDGDVNARIKDIWTHDTTNEWFAIGLNAKNGDVNLLAEGTVHAANGYAVTTYSEAGKSHIQVAKGAHVYGSVTALDSTTGGGSRFDVLGTIDSDTGPVIRTSTSDAGVFSAADVRIGTTGKVHGYMSFTDANDTVTNAGSWYASGGLNTFGAGNDRVTNVGTLALGGNDTWARFDGLETFENAGRVSLLNGRTGDIFGTSGTIHGLGGEIALDLDLATGRADQIQAGGFTGTSVIDLGVVGRASGLGLSDVVIATSRGEQAGDELVLSRDSRYRGFVGFHLAHRNGEYLLSSDIADEAYLSAAVPAGVRDLWRQGAQSVATHLDATHGGDIADGVWFQAVGGDFDGTSTLSHARGGRELEWHGSHEGAQAGFELAFGNLRAGVTGGFSEASMDIGTDERTTLDTVNAGLYARYDRNGWFAGGLLRAERVDVGTEWDSIGLRTDGDGSTVGVQLEGGYRFDMGAAYVAPTIRVNWIDVSLPDQIGENGTVRWEDGVMSTGEIGVLFAATEGWNGVRPYASASFAREYGDADGTLYDLGSEEVRVADAGDRAFGRVAAGAEWTVGRFDLYGEVETRVGDMEGTTGRLGARLRF